MCGMEVNGSIGVKGASSQIPLFRRWFLNKMLVTVWRAFRCRWIPSVSQKGSHARIDRDSWPPWDTWTSPGEMMWLQVCTAEQINSYTSLLLDSAASLEFNLLKLFEELKYAELCLKPNYILSCSCSTVWCFQAISELLGLGGFLSDY